MSSPLYRASRRVASRLFLSCVLASSLLAACDDGSPEDNDTAMDPAEGEEDDGDSGNKPGKLDASVKDSGSKPSDGSVTDAGKTDVGPATGLDGGKSDAGTGPAATPDGSTAPAGDLCHLKGYDVGVLGDSYIQLSGDFTKLVQQSARAAGALGANETYVDHAVSGASMNGSPNIPSQWPDAVADSKQRGGTGPKLVLMTGGGNDVLVNNRPCLNPTSVAAVAANATCVKVVDDTIATAQKLFDTAAKDGLKAIVYFFYPHLPKNSLLGGPNANNVLDYAAPKVQALCESQTSAKCFYVDMRPGFDDPKNPGWPRAGLIGPDGIHPTLEGSKILAGEVWKVMQAQCLGSK